MTAAEPAALPRHTGDAGPGAGGDPYADYRTPGSAGFPFANLPDLADQQIGGTVTACSDEYFAERENFLKPEPAHFDPTAFGPRGKIMDGWESRRRRGTDAMHPLPADQDHDWVLIRLGAPGVIRGIVVDTAHFRANYPQSISIEGTCIQGTPSPVQLLCDDVAWTSLVPRTTIGSHAANGFTVDAERRFTRDAPRSSRDEDPAGSAYA